MVAHGPVRVQSGSALDPINIDANPLLTVARDQPMVPHDPVRVQSGGTLRSEMPPPAIAGSSAIGLVDPISFDENPTRTVRKRRAAVVSSPYRVGFGGVPSLPHLAMAGPSAISHVDPISFKRRPMHTVPKRQETVISGPFRVRFGGIRSLPQPAPTDSKAIGDMDPINVDENPSRTVGKRRATVARGRTRVAVCGTPRPEMHPPSPMPTRASTRTSKPNTRKESGELFSQLAQGFRAISKTCKELGDALD